MKKSITHSCPSEEARAALRIRHTHTPPQHTHTGMPKASAQIEAIEANDAATTSLDLSGSTVSS